MNPRFAEEIRLLRIHYEAVEHKEMDGQHWFQISGFYTPEEWSPNVITVAFSVTSGYPGVKPYGFYVPENLVYKSQSLAGGTASHQPPFAGQWKFISWDPIEWQPAAEVRTGSNLWGWVRSFRGRLLEGA